MRSSAASRQLTEPPWWRCSPRSARTYRQEMSPVASNTVPSATANRSDHRWLVLVVVSIAQLMVVLDATVVNIALPSAQADLGFDNSDRQWVITAYALAFGSLLLLGGRVGDLFGRKATFIGGLVAFALASAIGGA